MRKRMFVLPIGLITSSILLTGCPGTTSGNDAGISQRVHGKRQVYDMPDGYPNIAAICVHGNLVVTFSTDVAGLNLPNSDACAGRDGVSPDSAR
jgi:predicted small secreted protein